MTPAKIASVPWDAGVCGAAIELAGAERPVDAAGFAKKSEMEE